MANGGCHRWSILGIIVAFLELFLAYILLCGSTFMFMASEFVRVFGLHLPCPCTGILGYQNKEMCLYKPLFHWPVKKIYAIQKLARNSLPLELFWHGDQDQSSDFMRVNDRRYGNRRLKIEDQTFPSWVSGSKSRNSVDKEIELDAKLAKIGNQKQKGIGRRRRKLGLGFGKSQSATSSGSSTLDSVYQMKSELNSFGHIDNDLKGIRSTSWDGVEGNISYGYVYDTVKNLPSVENQFHTAEYKSATVGDEANAMGILKQALAEEKSARAALYLELDKERAAAASAADEAMAMILRLQADKASLEMEAKQYERMMEERFMYDVEEMNVLKEIIIKREMDNHFLEKQLEAYQQIDPLENDSFENDMTSWNTDQKPDLSERKENVSCGKEPVVHDVHVIEDKTDVGEAKSDKAVVEYLGSDPWIPLLEERPRIGADGDQMA